MPGCFQAPPTRADTVFRLLDARTTTLTEGVGAGMSAEPS